jgi:hypothetical protein
MSAPCLKTGVVADDPVNWLDLVRQQVGSLQFGVVEIVVHDSRVVQIDKTERLRLGQVEVGKSRKLAPHASAHAAPIANASNAGAGETSRPQAVRPNHS